MKIVYKTFNSEEEIAELFNRWIINRHNINNKFIRIIHTGDHYAIFYPENLDKENNGLI